MVKNHHKFVLLAAGLLTLVWVVPQFGMSQEQQLVFSEVTVSGDEASLRLEFGDGEEFSAALNGGEVLLNGEVVATYEDGGALEDSWRALLSEAVAGDASALPALLRQWEPPDGLSGDALATAERLRDGLATTLEFPALANPAIPAIQGGTSTRIALESLVQSVDRLREIAAGLDDIDTDDLTVYVGEEAHVEEEETLEGSLLVVDGDLRLDGEVEGDVVLIGSSLELGPESRIQGVLRTADVEISGDREGVVGGITEIEVSPAAAALNLEPDRDIEAEIRDAVREATREANRSADRDSFRSFSSPLRWMGRGIAGLFQTLVTFGIMFAAGLAVLYFFPRHLEVVSRTARASAGRSLLVGLAGLVLACPLWIVGIVLLAISIIGIPLLIVWVPAVPLAVATGIAFGYLSIARNLGGWFSSKEFRPFEGVDSTRPAVQIGTGLVVLLGAYALANVFEMGGPLFGVFEGILMFAAVLGTMAAVAIGLGAVILSRAGRDPAFTEPGAGQGPKRSKAGTEGATAGV